jgi:hypothetical protein
LEDADEEMQGRSEGGASFRRAKPGFGLCGPKNRHWAPPWIWSTALHESFNIFFNFGSLVEFLDQKDGQPGKMEEDV